MVHKQSGEIDLKFSTEPVEQFAGFGSKGFFRPSSELAPVILGFFPKDFDHIELRSVRRQVAKNRIVVFHPAQGEAVVQVVVNAGIVQQSPLRP